MFVYLVIYDAGQVSLFSSYTGILGDIYDSGKVSLLSSNTGKFGDI